MRDGCSIPGKGGELKSFFSHVLGKLTTRAQANAERDELFSFEAVGGAVIVETASSILKEAKR